MNMHNLAVILFQPDIPPNTGNIIRLCANTGYELHLVKPLGFPLEDTKLRRAGLDYHEYANITLHENWAMCKTYFGQRRIIAIETCGTRFYNELSFTHDDVLLFGSETRGLPAYVLRDVQPEYIVKLPMQKQQRSLNLSNAVAIVAYEAWAQVGFLGGV